MARILGFLLAALALGGCVAASTTENAAATPSREMKMAFDVTDTATQPLLIKLETIETTRKQLIDQGYTPRIVVTFRGNASYFTQTDLSVVKEPERADALKVAAKLREMQRAPGVLGLERCNLPLADRKLNPANLMSEVKLVPNGWIALGAYQQQGYAYIAP